ncbi:MAG: hypothetical protein OIF54_00020, partial [Cohaesibacter sp.]|nr:hypothetical protein [Cohaesibacter sp.]
RYLAYDQKNIIKGLGEVAKNKEKYTDAFQNQTINFCEAMAKGSTLSQGSGIICNQNNQALKVTIIDTNQEQEVLEIEPGSWKLFDDILAAQIQTGKQIETVQFDPTSPVSKIVAKDGHWGFKALPLK